MAAERGALWALALACLVGCRPAAPPAPLQPASAVTPAGPGASAARDAADLTPRLELVIAPKIEPITVLVVTLQARGSPKDLGLLSISRAPAGSVSAITARDRKGPIAVQVRVKGDGLELGLGREPEPPLTLSYERAASAFSAHGPLGVALDPNRMAAAGDALLALPAAWTERAVPTTVTIDAKKLEPGNRGASGLGVGDRRTLELSGTAIRRMTFLGGPMGHAVLDGPEGHDEVAWLGYTSFDPRSVAAEIASFRTAAREYFGERKQAPFTLLLLSDSRPAGGFEVARQTASVLVNVGVNQVYGGPLRVAVNHQLLREWMGPALWIGPDSAERRGEALWFVEGVTRFLARELSFRFGLLTPAEYLTEVDEIERLVVTSPHAALSNAELAKKAAEPAAAALLVARGARHATAVDGRIRAHSSGKRSLDGVLRELYAQADRGHAALPDSAWSAALDRELGTGGAALFKDEIGAGKHKELPNDALGPCFAAGPRRFESFALGFEVDGDLAKLPAAVTRVAPASAAERAGVGVGDRILQMAQEAGSPGVPVRLEVERAGEKRRIEYRPVGALFAGRGFVRMLRVPDDRCVRR